MLKFPLKIEKEQDLNYDMMSDLLAYYAKNLVREYGDFLEMDAKFNGEVFLILHDGKIGGGSKAWFDFQFHPPYTKKREE